MYKIWYVCESRIWISTHNLEDNEFRQLAKNVTKLDRAHAQLTRELESADRPPDV